ncbi:MAG: hypothetical protein A2857_05600 [Candidatus Levybacteria bacterium RIFCSPHIGHO2_01_FULL_36_15]|nr:MAG: hypothetical protein A2857_05600 [Candidatus Levybacteria bacterium RIFCSPHIGHO2_01_FULL_36_15]OGH38992.1 MAG: hypothetical protein A2905_04750 [Candidatus Levybacteria bacterium RIFCSPLOWO2_01_FULL_36_10]
MKLQDLDLYTEIISKIVTILGIAIGGFWAYWIFFLKRTGVWNLQMNISTESIRYKRNLILLLIKVSLKNVGNVKISPGPSGCTLSVRKIPGNLPLGTIVDFESCQSLIEQVDILRRYKENDNYDLYEIEPNCEYHELETIVISKGQSLFIEVKFFSQDDSDAITEYCIINII